MKSQSLLAILAFAITIGCGSGYDSPPPSPPSDEMSNAPLTMEIANRFHYRPIQNGVSHATVANFFFLLPQPRSDSGRYVRDVKKIGLCQGGRAVSLDSFENMQLRLQYDEQLTNTSMQSIGTCRYFYFSSAQLNKNDVTLSMSILADVRGNLFGPSFLEIPTAESIELYDSQGDRVLITPVSGQQWPIRVQDLNIVQGSLQAAQQTVSALTIATAGGVTETTIAIESLSVSPYDPATILESVDVYVRRSIPTLSIKSITLWTEDGTKLGEGKSNTSYNPDIASTPNITISPGENRKLLVKITVEANTSGWVQVEIEGRTKRLDTNTVVPLYPLRHESVQFEPVI